MCKNQKASIWSLFALLSIWICVIISIGFSGSGADLETGAEEKRPVLILDAGHGGMDGGAVSVTGTRECELNWEIAERIYDAAGFLGLKTVRTRPVEKIEYPPELRTVAAMKKWDTRRRVEVVNRTDNGFLVSIHQNSYPSKGPRGIHVLYRHDDLSFTLAQRLQSAMSVLFSGSNFRQPVKAGKDIYLIAHSDRPAVLIECGFVSNPAEAVLLESESHQKKLSLITTAVFYNYTGDEVF